MTHLDLNYFFLLDRGPERLMFGGSWFQTSFRKTRFNELRLCKVAITLVLYKRRNQD